MKHSEQIYVLQEHLDKTLTRDWLWIVGDLQEIGVQSTQLEARLASARAIMQKFVDKVDRGMARSTETYAEMKEWLDE